MSSALDATLSRRPLLVAVAGPNGAGKSTFYHAFLSAAGVRFVNADSIGRTLGMDAYTAAQIANVVRVELAKQREDFVFETVFSDPVNDKVSFLREAAASGYNVVLCYVGIPGPEVASDRVAMRVSQGGHDVPAAKLERRYAQSLVNLANSIRELPVVFVFDNGDLARPFRLVAEFRSAKPVFRAKDAPEWLP